MVRRIAIVVLAAGLLGVWAQAQSEEGPPRIGSGTNGVASVKARRVTGEGTGTIRYDPGSPADGFLIAPPPLRTFGNRFDTGSGSPLIFPRTVTRVSWYNGAYPSGGGSAVLARGLLGATIETFVTVTGVVPYAFNSVTPTPWLVESAFFVGFVVPEYTTTPASFGSIGVRSASTNSQGFHGIQRNYSGGISNSLPGQNAMVRINSVIVPVELMEFNVD